MRHTFVVLGLTALVMAPSFASARDYCAEAAHNRRVTGTVVGGIGGALIGQAISHNTAGTVLGGVGGAVVGNQIARTSCDHHYAYHAHASQRYDDQRAAAYGAPAGCRYESRPYYDERGQMVYASTQVCR
jgi:uncharacterized protein YcfJ